MSILDQDYLLSLVSLYQAKASDQDNAAQMVKLEHHLKAYHHSNQYLTKQLSMRTLMLQESMPPPDNRPKTILPSIH